MSEIRQPSSKWEAKKAKRDAWLDQQQKYWNTHSYPQLFTRVGEIYEINFGMNIGLEFSGMHLAICLEDTNPSQELMTVIPLTTRYEDYNILPEDIVETTSTSGKLIKAGVSLGDVKRVSKHRISRASTILDEPLTVTAPVKGFIKIDKDTFKRWKQVI